MSKLQTIDEILIDCGITHLTGKEHDAIIVAFNQYSAQENKAITSDNTNLSIKNRELRQQVKNKVIEQYNASLKQDDLAHLNWMYSRLISVHGENPNYDYMLRMNKILTKIANNL